MSDDYSLCILCGKCPPVPKYGMVFCSAVCANKDEEPPTRCGRCGDPDIDYDSHDCETRSELADMVNHPSHYTSHPKGIECIDVVEDCPAPNLAQTMRYVWRVSWGGKWDDLEDLKKARWYLDREIGRRENGN